MPVFVPLLILTIDLFDLPLRIYWHSLSLRYEQSIQHWGSWLVDCSKAKPWLSVWPSPGDGDHVAIRNSPRRWWFYSWLAALPSCSFIFHQPLVHRPDVQQFEPLANQHPQLVASIENLTQRAGVPIPADRIFLMRAAKKPTPSTLTSPASAPPNVWSSGTPPSPRPPRLRPSSSSATNSAITSSATSPQAFNFSLSACSWRCT